MIHIVSAREGFMITCLYYGTKKEHLVLKEQYLSYGDKFQIGNKCRYIKDVGWFILIEINCKEEVFVQLGSIEDALQAKTVITMVELLIEVSILKHRLDHVLEKRIKDEFFQIAGNYTGFKSLLNKILPIP